MYEQMDINALFWHRAKIYLACIIPLLWLIAALPNMNTINLGVHNISPILNRIIIKHGGLSTNIPGLVPRSGR